MGMKQGKITKNQAMVYTALFAVIMAICSWISIPTTIPFTLQTFGVFTAVVLLGGKLGSLSVLIFILLGAVGVPVFAGFMGGPGVLLGTTGGYIIGFLGTALLMWLFEILFGTRPVVQILSMVLGLLVCYAFGTVWFMVVYARSNGAISVMTALGWCVFPYVIPDLVKLGLAYVVGKRVGKYVYR